MFSVFSRLSRKRKREDQADEQQSKAKRAKKVFESYSHIGYSEDKFHALFKTIPRSMENISDLISRHVVAFLNTGGGILSFGVSPSGTVYGEKINRKEEDNLKLAIDEVFKKIHPMVKPGMYRVTFTPVLDRDGGSSQSVLEIRVQKGSMFQLYETGMLDYKAGYLSKRDSQVFVRDGSSISGPLRPHEIKKIAVHLLKEKLDHQASLSEKLKSTAPSKGNSLKASNGNEANKNKKATSTSTKNTKTVTKAVGGDKTEIPKNTASTSGGKSTENASLVKKSMSVPKVVVLPKETSKSSKEEPAKPRHPESIKSSGKAAPSPKTSAITKKTQAPPLASAKTAEHNEVIVISSSEESPVTDPAMALRAPLVQANKNKSLASDRVIHISSSDECPLPKENKEVAKKPPPKKKFTKRLSTLVNSIKKSVRNSLVTKPVYKNHARKSSLPTIGENVGPPPVQRSTSVSNQRNPSSYHQRLPPQPNPSNYQVPNYMYQTQPAKPPFLMPPQIQPPAYPPHPHNLPPPLMPPPPIYSGHGYWTSNYHSRYGWNY